MVDRRRSASSSGDDSPLDRRSLPEDVPANVVALAFVVDHELSDVLGKSVALPVPLGEQVVVCVGQSPAAIAHLSARRCMAFAYSGRNAIQ